jgi:NAD(P)-dependent dehydrogenase (short-subunit alcohol dehydrogenase family)
MSDSMFDLTGKVALVTGGSRGLGRAMAEAFAERGADLIVASRRADACEAAAREIAARFGVTALPVACNVSRWDNCDALIDRAYAKLGRVDVLVNNAGMSPLYPSLDQVRLDADCPTAFPHDRIRRSGSERRSGPGVVQSHWRSVVALSPMACSTWSGVSSCGEWPVAVSSWNRAIGIAPA